MTGNIVKSWVLTAAVFLIIMVTYWLQKGVQRPLNKQRFLSELQKLLVFMTDEDRDLVIERLEEMFELAGPEGENGVIGMLGSATRTAIRLSRGYEPGYIPELPDMAIFTGEPAQPEAEPEPEDDLEYASEAGDADAVLAEEQAGDSGECGGPGAVPQLRGGRQVYFPA